MCNTAYDCSQGSRNQGGSMIYMAAHMISGEIRSGCVLRLFVNVYVVMNSPANIARN